MTSRLWVAGLSLGLAIMAVMPQQVWAQTTDFGVVEKSVKLPKGSKIDPRYKLRQKIPKPEDVEKEPPKPDDSAETKKKTKTEELDEKLMGAWTLVAPIRANITNGMVEQAARRCLLTMQRKPLIFENTAIRELPGIFSLIGDIVYYRSEKGIQRLDIQTGRILLLPDFEKRQIGTSQTVWLLNGRARNIRVRFSQPFENAPDRYFMIEESGFYLRCQSPTQAKETKP